MTRFLFQSKEDRDLIKNSYDNMANLMLGTRNKEQLADFERLFTVFVKYVKVHPQGTVTKYINEHTSGICGFYDNQKLKIEFLGYTNPTSNRTNRKMIKHTGTHEFCHAFNHLLALLCAEHPKGVKIDNDTLKRSFLGSIYELDKDGNIKDSYGEMFNETTTDILTSIAINEFDPNSNKTMDDILNNHYSSWNDSSTGYSFLTSITRLVIAAFSNNPNINYSSIIKNGYGITGIKTKMKNGELYKTNDFLYGITCDPMHIEKTYDKFMGNGEYKKLCKVLDSLLESSKNNRRINKQHVKVIMNTIPDFLNTKMQYYLSHSIMDENDTYKIISNFNKIWNNMQHEYSTFFSQEEINKITERAYQKKKIKRKEDDINN